MATQKPIPPQTEADIAADPVLGPQLERLYRVLCKGLAEVWRRHEAQDPKEGDAA